MTTEDLRTERLRRIPLFEDLSEEALAHVARCATEFEVSSGHVLMERRQPGSGLFVIQEGSAVVELPDREIELGPGEFFGELALLDDRAVHSARVRTTSTLRGLAISRGDFDDLLDAHADVTRSVLKNVARRLAEVIEGA